MSCKREPDITGREVLDLPCKCMGEPSTIREYLRALLLELWDQRECFSGKYGLGNSDWDWELLLGLAEAKLISARIDREDGEVVHVHFPPPSLARGHVLIDRAIRALH